MKKYMLRTSREVSVEGKHFSQLLVRSISARKLNVSSAAQMTI